MPKVVVDEWISITFDLRNSLRINMTLFDITLLWKFVEQHQHVGGGVDENKAEMAEITNEQDSLSTNTSIIDEIAECSSISELTMAPTEAYRLRLKLKAKKSHGHLHILGIKYKFCLGDNVKIQMSDKMSLDKELIVGKQLFELRGARLNNNQQTMRSIVYDVDNRLNLKIINKTPLMQVVKILRLKF